MKVKEQYPNFNNVIIEVESELELSQLQKAVVRYNTYGGAGSSKLIGLEYELTKILNIYIPF